jgi:hypothetical protein
MVIILHINSILSNTKKNRDLRELKILLLRKSIDESKKKIGKWDCLNKNISNYRLREKNQKKKMFPVVDNNDRRTCICSCRMEIKGNVCSSFSVKFA